MGPVWLTSSLYSLTSVIACELCRRKKIAENMARTTKIIEEYKTRMREIRAKRKEGKRKVEIAGNSSSEAWV